MTSLFHKFKKAVAHTPKESSSLCPEYDTTKVDFESLHDAMIRIRQQLLTYREANGRLWLASTSLSTDFAQQLEMDMSHPYTAMAATVKSSHAALPTEKEKLDTMLNACLAPLKAELDKMDALRERMAQHDKVKEEVIYYQTKVDGLKHTREQNKKPESQAEKDKYERNIKKMQDQELTFRSMDSALVADLQHTYAHRVAVLGPIMLAFVRAEKELAASYQTVLMGVQLVDQTEANIWLQKHEAEFAARQAELQRAAEAASPQSPRSPAVVLGMPPTAQKPQPDLLSHDAMAGAAVVPVSATGTVGDHITNSPGNPLLHEQYVLTSPATGQAVGTAGPFVPAAGAGGAAGSLSQFNSPTSDEWLHAAAASSSSPKTAEAYPSTFDNTPYTMGSASTYTASSLNGSASSSKPITPTSAAAAASAPSAPLADLKPNGSLIDADAASKEGVSPGEKHED